ncbi:MAG: hypothetical protein KGS72_01835 [Cyanobacteria bacterium REEB67]|nr:hypothetical protein [Cyanobacteria bacterium REEB67]
MIYTNPLKPALSPAYDFVPTIGYISQGVHPDLGKGIVRAFVGEHLYRQWRQLNFITIEPPGPMIAYEDITTWRGEIQSFSANFPMATWRKIVSAFERRALERFDTLQRDGSIRTFSGKILEVNDIKRDDKTGATETTIKVQSEEDQILLNPHVGIAYLSSDFERCELRSAIQSASSENNWEVGIFSEPSKIAARKKIEKTIKKT